MLISSDTPITSARPEPLSNSFWAFLFPHVPFIPSIPSASDIADGAQLPSDSQLNQRVLWISFLIVLAWSFLGLAGALPLYLINTPCLANSVPQASFSGVYSTLQDLSVLRLLQLLENGDVATSGNIQARELVNGEDFSSNVRTRLIILAVFAIVLAMLPALYKILREFTRHVNYRRHWLEVRCEGMELGWLSARRAPGFVGWGEKRLKDFLVKTGLSSTLDRSGGIVGGNMAGIGSGFRGRNQRRTRDPDEVDRPLNEDEKADLEVDLRTLFSIRSAPFHRRYKWLTSNVIYPVKPDTYQN